MQLIADCPMVLPFDVDGFIIAFSRFLESACRS